MLFNLIRLGEQILMFVQIENLVQKYNFGLFYENDFAIIYKKTVLVNLPERF